MFELRCLFANHNVRILSPSLRKSPLAGGMFVFAIWALLLLESCSHKNTILENDKEPLR